MPQLLRGLRLPLAAALLAATGAHAASIVGDTFSLGVSYDDPAGGGTIQAGPASGTASGAAGLVSSASESDVVLDFIEGGSSLTVHALWIDDDTVHLFFQGDSTEFTNLVLTVSALDFKSGSTPVTIDGAVFDRNGGGANAFAGFNEVITGIVQDPTVSFTASSVSLTFTYFSGALVADGPTMEIHVNAGMVPEPGTYALLLGGLGLVGLARAATRRPLTSP